MLQGLVFFGGVTDFVSASFTFTPGISPSVAQIQVLPGTKATQNSDLVFVFGSRSIRFKNCRLDNVSSGVDEQGRTVWTLEILDRRWTWRDFGKISGFYNVRTDEDTIQPGTEKTPRELATLCLEAMGEKGFDVSALPNKTRPETDWEFTNPAQALARICDSLGCLVALGLDDKVRICKIGEGANLPTADLLSGEVSIDPPDPPKDVSIVGGRTRFQGELDLEPVGIEIDGTVKPIAALSYIPSVGGVKTWRYSDADHFTGLKVRKHRELARKSVFRWYRIKTPLRLPKLAEVIRELSRILPLESTQVEIWKNPETGLREARPPWVYGSFWEGEPDHEPPAILVDPDIGNRPRGLYTKGFSVDLERGIVKFSRPVYLMTLDPTVAAGRTVEPAKLRLRIACNVRDKNDRSWLRQEGRKRLANGGRDGTLYAIREDVVREIYQRSSPPPAQIVDNLAKVKEAATFYFEAIQRGYAPKESGTVGLMGLVPLAVDGAILQVTWTIGENGVATTRASRNREELLIAQSFKEARFVERLNRALRERDKPERLRAEDARKKRGK